MVSKLKDRRCPLPMPRPAIYSSHMTNSRYPVWTIILLILIILKRPIFKNHTRANGLLIAKIKNYWPIYGKKPLDTKAAIRYLNSGCWHHNENWRRVSGPTAYCDSTDYRTQSKIGATFGPQKRILIIEQMFYNSYDTID